MPARVFFIEDGPKVFAGCRRKQTTLDARLDAITASDRDFVVSAAQFSGMGFAAASLKIHKPCVLRRGKSELETGH
jgi:hypothetical protein